MNLQALNEVAEKMVAPGRGILAADESTGTIKKRFDPIGVECTQDNRRDYRELMFRATEAMQYISGVILYDETIWQDAADGTPLVKLIQDADAIPGIKVDKGAQPMAGFPGETITEGLDGLGRFLVCLKDFPIAAIGVRDAVVRLRLGALCPRRHGGTLSCLRWRERASPRKVVLTRRA